MSHLCFINHEYHTLLMWICLSFVSGSVIDTLMSISYAIIPHYFSRWKNVAIAIMTSGASLCQMVMPMVITYLQEEYGFRGAILITGAVILNCVPASMVFHPVEWHRNTPRNHNSITTHKHVPNVNKKISSTKHFLQRILTTSKYNLRLLKSLRILFLVAVISLSHVLFYNVHALVPLIMNEQGNSWQESSLCLTVSGACNLVSKLMTACLSCRPNTIVRPTFIVGLFLCGVGTFGK